MEDVDAFVSTVSPRLKEEVEALQGGDPAPWLARCSHREPVTLGASLMARGWSEIEPAFQWLASHFHGSESYDYEILAAGVSGDLAYIAGIEHGLASVGNAGPTSLELRVTTVFRREGRGMEGRAPARRSV
jgi:ketosteroid isomerase-like protein